MNRISKKRIDSKIKIWVDESNVFVSWITK